MKLSEFKALSAMLNGEQLERPVYIESMEDKVNRTGKSQVTLKVRDGVGVSPTQVSIFDTDVKNIQERHPYAVQGAVVVLQITRKDAFYNADKYRIKEPSDEYDLEELAEKATDKDPEELYDYILSEVDKVAKSDNEYDSLADLVKKVYEKRKEAILKSSSAISFHHTGISGNIVHTTEVLNICTKLLETQIGEDIDSELLLAAAALHDVGKLTCYETNEMGGASLTFEGEALGGHHYYSLRAVEEAVKEGNYDPERVLILQNIIASHHGDQQFGDIAKPITLEGFWLHMADELSATTFRVKSKIMSVDPGTFATETLFSVKNRYYRRTDQ